VWFAPTGVGLPRLRRAGPSDLGDGGTLGSAARHRHGGPLLLFELEVSDLDGVEVCTVIGELDVASAPKLRQALIKLVAEASGPPRVVVDLAGVDFLDSTGLGVLLGGLKRVRAADGAIAVCRAEPQVRKVFEVTRVVEILPVHDDLDGALAAVRGEGA
jgi:anti-sigma B factor antagonist